MRVYVPLSLAGLAALRDGSSLPPGAAVHAVTPSLRARYGEGDTEELEHAAMLDAAEAALGRLAVDGSAPRRRVVLAADVPDGAVRAQPRPPAADDGSRDDGSPSRVLLAEPLTMRQAVSVHVDDADAEPDVAAALAALEAADAGEPDAVDGARGHDLLWYDIREVGYLLADLLPVATGPPTPHGQ